MDRSLLQPPDSQARNQGRVAGRSGPPMPKRGDKRRPDRKSPDYPWASLKGLFMRRIFCHEQNRRARPASSGRQEDYAFCFFGRGRLNSANVSEPLASLSRFLNNVSILFAFLAPVRPALNSSSVIAPSLSVSSFLKTSSTLRFLPSCVLPMRAGFSRATTACTVQS